MKRHLLAVFIAVIILMCPIMSLAGAEVFAQGEASAQSEAEQAEAPLAGEEAAQATADQTAAATVQPGWNADRSVYYLEDGTAATGLFWAKTASGADALYYADKNGVVKSSAAWVYQDGNKYRVTKSGTVRTKEGVFLVGKYRYVIPTGSVNGAICRKVGPVEAGGKLYYVGNKNGRLGTHKAYKKSKKIYHVTSKGVVTIGKHKWKDGKYYYSVKKGYLKTSGGMVVSGKKRFYVKKGGLVKVSQKFKYKDNYYIAGSNGNVCTGLFKWKGNLYYASDEGILKASAGIVTVDGSDYYVAKGGSVYVSKLISANGKKYAADSSGKLLTGLFRLNGTYYFAEKDHTIRTSAEVFKYGKHYYFNKKGGSLARNEFVEFEGKHYYAGDDAAFMTSTFDMKGVTFNPSKEGVLPEEEYRKLYPLDDADDDY